MTNFSVPVSTFKQVHEAYLSFAKDNFYYFVRGLRTMGANGLISFDEAMAQFQRDFFLDIAPGLEAIKNGQKPEKRRFWLERTKKSSKDTDIASCVVWLIAFTERPLLIQICAANRNQAAIVEDRVLQLIHYNPWLSEIIEVVGGTIRKKSMPKQITARIESTSNAGSAQGPTPDLLVLNELVHVDRWDVMEAHMNNADGVPNGIVVVSTNAGVKGTPAHIWKLNAENNTDRWACHTWAGKAPWLSDQDMEDARRRDPVGKEFARLWKGIWVSGSGDAVDEASIEDAFRLSGPLESPKKGWTYLAGLDLGISHDHAGLAIVGVSRDQQLIEAAKIKAWVPTLKNDRGTLEVDIRLLRQEAVALAKKFNVVWFGYDPAAGGSFLAQEMRRQGIPMREMTFASDSNMTKMAMAFVSVLKARRAALYDDPEGRLRRDFAKFSIKHRPPSSYKLEAVSDGFGHADVGTAFVITLPRALEMMEMEYGFGKDDDLFMNYDDEELTDLEVETMPADLLDIYNDNTSPLRRLKPGSSNLPDENEDEDALSSIYDF